MFPIDLLSFCKFWNISLFFSSVLIVIIISLFLLSVYFPIHITLATSSSFSLTQKVKKKLTTMETKDNSRIVF